MCCAPGEGGGALHPDRIVLGFSADLGRDAKEPRVPSLEMNCNRFFRRAEEELVELMAAKNGGSGSENGNMLLSTIHLCQVDTFRLAQSTFVGCRTGHKLEGC